MKKAIKYLMLITLGVLLVLTFSALVGCKKEIIQVPQVQIFKPFKNAFFGFGDTVFIEASVSHPELSAVTLTIVNSAYQPVEEVIQISLKGTDFTFSNYIIVKNKAILSGKHYVRVQAIALGESYNSFLEINLAELQKERLTIFVATEGKLSAIYPWNISTGEIVYSGPRDFSGMATNSNSASVFYAPKTQGNLLQLNASSNAIVWEDPNNALSGASFMTGARNFGNTVFGFYGDGRVIEYKNYGGYDKVFQLSLGFVAEDAMLINSTLVLLARNFAVARLYFYNASSAAYISHFDVPQNQEHIALEPFGNDNFLMIYNDNGLGDWNQFQLNGQEVNMPTLPPLGLYDAESVSSNAVVLATNAGVKLYQSNQAALTTLIAQSSVPIKHIVFDEVSQQLIYTGDQHVRIAQFPSMNFVGQYFFANQTFLGLSVLYNK